MLKLSFFSLFLYTLNMKIIYTKNEKETKKTAFNLALNFKGGEILALQGELGSGKTSFTKGIAQALNIKKRVCSPTFVILNQYQVKSRLNKNIKFLYHIDAYRLKTKRDLENIGFFDIINDPESLIVIEWADKIKKYLPPKSIWLNFSIIKSNDSGLAGQRKIEIFS